MKRLIDFELMVFNTVSVIYQQFNSADKAYNCKYFWYYKDITMQNHTCISIYSMNVSYLHLNHCKWSIVLLFVHTQNYAYLSFCNVIAKLLKKQADHLVSGALEMKRYYMVLGRTDIGLQCSVVHTPFSVRILLDCSRYVAASYQISGWCPRHSRHCS